MSPNGLTTEERFLCRAQEGRESVRKKPKERWSENWATAIRPVSRGHAGSETGDDRPPVAKALQQERAVPLQKSKTAVQTDNKPQSRHYQHQLEKVKARVGAAISASGFRSLNVHQAELEDSLAK